MGKFGKSKGSKNGLSRSQESTSWTPNLAPGVPSWDGDPNLFQAFAKDCEWYLGALKDNERHLASSRVWQNLRGSARLAVDSLKASDFGGKNGLTKLIRYLGQTPLARQPLPDAYQKIDGYRSIKRRKGENAADYVLREEQAYSIMLRSLRRLRRTGEEPVHKKIIKKVPRRTM